MTTTAGETSRRNVTLNVKMEQYRSLLQTCREDVNKVLQTLGWSQDYLRNKTPDLVTCPVDGSHLIPELSLSVHSAVCQLVGKGLSKSEAKEIVDSSDPFPERMGVKIDQATLTSILSQYYLQNHGTGYVKGVPLPVTHEDATVFLSPDERLALHDYVVQTLKKRKLEAVQNVDKDLLLEGLESGDKDEKAGEMSLLEQLAASRDYKRRRQSYRAKNVHTSSKSYIEVIREVISSQMEIFQPPVEEREVTTEPDRMEERARASRMSGMRDTDSKRSPSARSPSISSKRSPSIRSKRSPSARSKHKDRSSRDSPDDRRKKRKEHKHKHHKHKRHKSDKKMERHKSRE